MTDHPSALVSVPVRGPGHCDDDGAWAEFVRQYGGQPRSRPDMTDFALANRVFMADRNDLDLIVWQTAAKERIRWLSIELAKALAAAPAAPQAAGVGEKSLGQRAYERMRDHNDNAIKSMNSTVQWSELSEDERKRWDEDATGRPFLYGLRAPSREPEGGAVDVEAAWQELLEKDDRNSPEDRPDMLLITRDELSDFMAFATREEAPDWTARTEAAWAENNTEEALAGAGPVCLEIPLSNHMRVTLEYGPDGSRTATLWNEANEPIADGDAPSLRAQPPAREDAQPVAWRSIDGAPKDGTTVDVWRDDGGRETVFWGYPHHECGEMGSLCDSDWHSLKSPGWVCATFNEFIGGKHNPFTHWKPVDGGPNAILTGATRPAPDALKGDAK